jgi:hypothetical protein
MLLAKPGGAPILQIKPSLLSPVADPLLSQSHLRVLHGVFPLVQPLPAGTLMHFAVMAAICPH